MTQKSKIETLMSEMLSTERLVKGKQPPPRQTLEDSREEILGRAEETLAFLRNYEGGKFKAPMARSKQNAIAIKIGYGLKNEKLFSHGQDSEGRELDCMYANGFTHEERVSHAISIFEAIVAEIKAGDLDERIQEKLTSFRERAARGKAKRMGVKLVRQLDVV